MPKGAGKPQTGVASCGGASNRGLLEHPPPSGATCAVFLLGLPGDAAALETAVGIADGSLSAGVLFIVRANFREVARVEMLPSYWKDLTVDLSPWAGAKVLLALETDPNGMDYYDWAAWGEPRIVAVSEIWLLSPVAPLAMILRFSSRRQRGPA